MIFKDDEAVIVMLFRNGSVMKPLGQTFSSFCQWCAQHRAIVKGEAPDARALMCPTCDRGDK